MGRIHFSTILKPMRRYLQKDADAAISFTEIADSNLNAVAPRSVLEKKKSDTARSQYSEYYVS